MSRCADARGVGAVATQGRPQGEVRRAMADAARALHAECGAASWRDMAVRAQVGFKAAQRTAENMARAGELRPVGAEKRAHSRRWVTLYAPAGGVAVGAGLGQGAWSATSTTQDTAAPALERVVRQWRR